MNQIKKELFIALVKLIFNSFLSPISFHFGHRFRYRKEGDQEGGIVDGIGILILCW